MENLSIRKERHQDLLRTRNLSLEGQIHNTMVVIMLLVI